MRGRPGPRAGADAGRHRPAAATRARARRGRAGGGSRV